MTESARRPQPGGLVVPLILGLIAGGALVATLAYPLATRWRFFELFSFVRPEILAAVAAGVGFSLALGDRLHRTLMTALLLLNAALVVGPALLFGTSASPACEAERATDDGLRLVTLNLLSDNRDLRDVADFMEAVGPDVVVLQEASSFWDSLIDRLRRDRAHRLFSLDLDRRLVVVSRWPLQLRETIEARGPDGRRTQALVVRVRMPGAVVDLHAVHPDTPRSEALWRTRNATFDLLADLLAEARGDSGHVPVLVVGDWNTAPWSPTYQRFLARADLRQANPALLPGNTRFFAGFGLGTLLGSPVDHVAVSAGIAVACFSRGPKIGSDHLPLIADLRLPGR